MSTQDVSSPEETREKTRSTSRVDGREPSGWGIFDEVVRLRQWGMDTMYELPQLATWRGGERLVGSGRACGLRIEDSEGTVSRRHALLLRGEDRWVLLDLGSKNGIRIDGVPQPLIRLEPGMVLTIGRLTFVAESAASIALRSFLARLLGWGPEDASAVDVALQDIRTAQVHRDPVVLLGNGDLTSVARDLHEHLFGRKAPFVTCNPRRMYAAADNVRTARNEPSLRAAMASASGGTVYLRAERMPKAFAEVVEAHREGGARVQVIIGGVRSPQVGAVRVAEPLVIPPLTDREDQIGHIISEYYEDIMVELGVSATLSPEERQWIRAHSESVADIAKATRRILALRLDGSVNAAAARLGMAPASLRKWLGMRTPPPLDLAEPSRGSWAELWHNIFPSRSKASR